MHSLAHYALLGSLIAGAAGALVLAVITFKHGIARRSSSDQAGLAPEESARRAQTVRLADTVAVLCFAVAAGLGAIGLTQSMRVTPLAIAAVDDTAMREKLGALEGRLANAEQQLQNRPDVPDMRAWEERLARLENRLGAVEDRAAVAERRATDADRRATEAEQLTRRELRTRATSAAPAVAPAPAKKAATPTVANPANVTPSIPPSASPRLNPPGRDGLRPPELPSRQFPPEPKQEATGPAATEVPPAANDESAASTATTLPPSTPREPTRAPADTTLREPGRPRAQALPPPLRAEAVARDPARAKAEPPPREGTLGDKLRRDWAVIREHADRGGAEWREGWRQIKSLFGQ